VLIALVALYLAVSVAIGLYAATRVRGSGDYAVARKSFGTPIVAAAFFATWFGAETVLGIPATFLKEGLRGLVADPFAAFGCLALIGLVFARPLFRFDVVTLGDYFRVRYGRTAEIALTLCIAFSYIGWIAAQLVALGLALNVISGGAVSTHAGILVGAVVVLVYTIAGGMWSVALTDFFQAVVIVVGLAYVAWVVVDSAGGAARVIEAAGSDRLQFLPEPDLKSVLAWVSAALVVMLGSVPQQDVLQRVMSAKDERIAARATIIGAAIYFVIATLPIVLVCSALVIDAPMVQRLVGEDYQLILPTLILERTPVVVQALFFGALISAILSTASGALLAPAVALAENVLRPLVKPKDDHAVLKLMRVSVAVLAVAVTAMALTSKLSIYQLVNNSGQVVLVSSFVPMAAAMFWPRADARAAHASIAAGLIAWILMEWLFPEGLVPSPLGGLIASFVAMVGVAMLPRRGARSAS
jgi:Na+/proline symporter